MIFHIVYFPPWANTHSHIHTHLTVGKRNQIQVKLLKDWYIRRQDNDYKQGKGLFEMLLRSLGRWRLEFGLITIKVIGGLDKIN